ncbi:MAG: aminomethyl-transferring glycine dehydrogenase subunit GcvPB [Actinomycetes bacterium]|jgi:glycine dehydrogenase subunit 2|nr:aminomethyl-transferring glycine dehydrogenase subunit GcvPB [Actinomycetes bacterium]
MSEPVIYDLSAPGKGVVTPPASPLPPLDVQAAFGSYAETDERARPHLPQVSEVEIMRHYTHLSAMNFGVDSGAYPLGSCTMKYNPRINEDACRLPGFAELHPAQPPTSAQGALRLMYELQTDLATASGFAATSLQPAAGAHGEYTALMVFRAALAARGEAKTRTVVLIPDTAHGTNPASVTMAGFTSKTIPSTEEGLVDVQALKAALGPDVAAFMLTNPNTVGIFDPQILEMTAAVHEAGAYAYCDGANFNAILGVVRPGDLGFDALHINLHKTFSTPHGGGGPGAGPICVTEELADFLPGPVVERVLAEGNTAAAGYRFVNPPRSIGRVRSWYGNFGVMVRAWVYIRALGAAGLRKVGQQAVLSANYLRVLLEGVFEVAYNRICMHEFVLSGAPFAKAYGVHTLDIAKRLLDFGFHPPTIYFPLIVEEAMMFEPTETEPLASLDALASALLSIAQEAETNPELLHSAPHSTPVRRLDEAGAARDPQLRWTNTTEVA